MLKVSVNITMKGCIKTVSLGTDIILPYKSTVINTQKCNFKLHAWGERGLSTSEVKNRVQSNVGKFGKWSKIIRK